jgi:hypothetical protein
LISQYGKNFRGCLRPVKAIIGPKVEQAKAFVNSWKKCFIRDGGKGPEKLDRSWGWRERGKRKNRMSAIKLCTYDWEGQDKIWTSGRIDTNRMFQRKCSR